MSDGKQIVQRHQSAAFQQAYVMRERLANSDAVLARRFERRINFRHAFVQPKRPEQIVMAQEQMRVFVKDAIERFRAVPGNGERDQVFIAAAMKERRQIRRLALIQRKKWFHGWVSGKCHHDNWRRGDGLCARQQRIGLAELFQTPSNSRDLLRGAATIDVEMGGARLEPVFLGQWKRLSAYERGKRDSKRNQKKAKAPAHIQGKNGLCCFSSPTVVSGPCPGQSIVSSGNVRIWSRLFRNASA